jgi:hypothetical protein
MATQGEVKVDVNKAAEEFLRDVDKLRALESVDRAQLAAAFQKQAERLIREEVQPVVQRMLMEVALSAAAARSQASSPPPPAPPQSSHGDGAGGDLPRRVERLEGKVDRMADDIGEIKVSLGKVNERLGHMPTKADMGTSLFKQYLAVFGALITSTLGLAAIMAKGFGWL